MQQNTTVLIIIIAAFVNRVRFGALTSAFPYSQVSPQLVREDCQRLIKKS